MKKLLLIISAGIMLLLPPLLSTAQAPNLGTAGSFALFTSIGAVGNTGQSHVTGNVGTNNGSITGFGNVNGVMHNSNVTTSTAASDLLIAYNLLNSAIPNFFIAPLIGNGDTLVKGVYSIAGVSTLSNDLYLDAKGDANAVFIFQMSTAFSSSPNAKVKLINGAQACNVFWKVEGAVTLQTATFMRGNIVANNGAINLSTNDTLEGRALSTTGAVNISTSLAYTPKGCGSLSSVGPVAPTLGTAECYAIFSGNGSVTNAGITYVTGDVGTNVGLAAGFDPLKVNGTIHTNPDVSTAQAAVDLVVAYNYLNVLPYDIELMYPAQFGNDLVLTPNTYLMNSAAAFNGNLYLNAEGNSNAVFVIQINGALSTSTFSRVILMNGAKANNVFWKVDGAASINDYSVFHGTIIVNNGALNLATGDSLYGRAFTTSGALSVTAMTTISPKVTCIALPVNWLYFKGKSEKTNVLLEWGTAVEVNNQFFTIEKSRDGVRFETLATVKSVTGNEKREYSFLDVNPYTLGYYRISQTDRDGSRNYYRTIQVGTAETPGMKVIQTLQGNDILLQISGAKPGAGSLEMYNTGGLKIASQKIVLTTETNTYHMQKPARKGVYLINITSKGGKVFTNKLMVQ